ncbi:MAG: hypothetical protein ACKO1F_15135 [Flammeovirgaceae bacterium]
MNGRQYQKYRNVFDRWELNYERAEFPFFNKLFDEEDWDAYIRMKCFFQNGSQKEIPDGSRV